MYSTTLLALALSSVAFASPLLTPRDGFGVTTFSAAGCQGSNQGTSNVGATGTTCVEMGFANAFQVGGGCTNVQVAYHHNAGCTADEPTEIDTVQEGCVNIPNVGTHFSAVFSCLD